MLDVQQLHDAIAQAIHDALMAGYEKRYLEPSYPDTVAGRILEQAGLGQLAEQPRCAECGGIQCPTCGQGCVDAPEAHAASVQSPEGTS